MSINKRKLIELLTSKHERFYAFLETFPDDQWKTGPDNKWRTCDHVLHLIQSLQPLNKALSIPKLVLLFKFGRTNRPIRAYDEVLVNYLDKLEQNPGVVSPLSKDMSAADSLSKTELITKLKTQETELINNTSSWKDQQLNKYILPHPLMGKMPISELLMWTAYHTEHHHYILKNKYQT